MGTIKRKIIFNGQCTFKGLTKATRLDSQGYILTVDSSFFTPKQYNNSKLSHQFMVDALTTYDEYNDDILFTEDETRSLLKLSEKEILILVLSEMKKQTKLLSKK